MSLERAHKMESIWLGQWKVSSPLLSLLLASSASLLPSSLPRSPSSASPKACVSRYPGGRRGSLAPNHPELAGGNRRPPAGYLVTATPTRAAHIPPHTGSTGTLGYSYPDVCSNLLASLQAGLLHPLHPGQGHSLASSHSLRNRSKAYLNQFKPA